MSPVSDRFHPATPVAASRPKALARRLWHVVPRSVRWRVTRLRRRRNDNTWTGDFDFTPPRLPRGLVAAPPDFIGVGTGRSGTTWWYGLMVQHPELYHHARMNKERNYLATQFAEQEPVAADVDRYACWFPRPPGMRSGEWTPWYLSHVWMGDVLQRVAPEAKLLVMLRDPVDRYRSHVEQGLAMGRDLVEQNAGQIAHGCYSFWLDRLEAFVPRERLLVLQYERCVVSPQVEMDRTMEFLGLDPHPIDDTRADPSAGRPKQAVLPDEVRRLLVERYRPDAEALAARYPEIDLDLWPSFRAV
jgi:hypothetical protein